jgi:lysophospholipase L1-like esterase
MKRTAIAAIAVAALAASLTVVTGARADGQEAVSAIGVVDQPCAGVPIAPTDAHRAAADWYRSWMHDWLALDWAQHCRYQAENAALPSAIRRRVVYLGDSITEGWKNADPTFFNDGVLDRGISGQTTAQMLLRLRSDVLELHPQVVHIMAGTNDVAGNTGATSLAQIEGNIASMAELARAHGIRVVLASIPPAARFPWQPALRPAVHIQALNAWLKAYAQREGFVYADYYSALANAEGALPSSFSEDGVHPNAAGYAVMKPIAEQSVAAALRRRPK